MTKFMSKKSVVSLGAIALALSLGVAHAADYKASTAEGALLRSPI